ncbi:MAG: sensor domain-containing diguanylate cyclase, partial [Gammaproteobacteria bacterium]|nr:sensor domain-containing diguanylate cyclase [Gammaproteobacteria bacterium]
MQEPPVPENEAARLEELHSLNILDTDPEERFDRLTRLAARLFDVPIALVSLVDEERQWFKSCVGLDAKETSRAISFCGHAIMGNEIFLVQDASADTRFADNPLVTDAPAIRFYAGRPLRGTTGNMLGTLCLIDQQSHDFCEDDAALLNDLARMAEQELAAVELATMDELTLLSNRRGFKTLAMNALSLCRRLERPTALLYFDLDLFKQINDTFGHAEGDFALRRFATLLKDTFRESDVIGRLGGDEFAVLMSNAREPELEAALDRLQETVAHSNGNSSRGYQLLYSAGAVCFDPERHGGIADLMN